MAVKHVTYHPNLIYDVGMHTGEDSSFYLKKGFDVVGFEANPDLIEISKKTFSSAIQNGRLRILEGAIVSDPDVPYITFYRYDDRTKWGTISSDLVASSGKRAHGVSQIKVATIDFAAMVEQIGMPYYLKIDIEGADIHCLESLKKFSQRPAYVSIEAIEQDIGMQKAQIELLSSLGYNRFKAVQQARMHRRKLPQQSTQGLNVPHTFSKGSSGPFGSDLAGAWRNAQEIISDYDTIFSRNRRLIESSLWKYEGTRKMTRKFIEWAFNVTVPGWYDTHARHTDWEKLRGPSGPIS